MNPLPHLFGHRKRGDTRHSRRDRSFPAQRYKHIWFDKPTHQMLTLGVVAGTGNTAWSFLFDNAVCDRLP